MRDELVRAVMPELHVLLQHSVNAAVERAMAPLLERQRELEAELTELRALARPAAAPSATSTAAVVSRDALVRPVATASPAPHATTTVAEARGVSVASPVAHSVVSRGVESIPVISDAPHTARVQGHAATSLRDDDLYDIPSELNGSKRKKLLLGGFVAGLLLLLLSAAGASLASNLGVHF
jgi:hypothetical protein